MNKFKFAGIQLKVGSNKVENVKHAVQKIGEAAGAGAQVIALPECFNCPYSNDSFGPYAEPVPAGDTAKMLSQAAKTHGVYLIGGSFPERDDMNKLYNTCLVFDPDGKLIGKHRKV